MYTIRMTVFEELGSCMTFKIYFFLFGLLVIRKTNKNVKEYDLILPAGSCLPSLFLNAIWLATLICDAKACGRWTMGHLKTPGFLAWGMSWL